MRAFGRQPSARRLGAVHSLEFVRSIHSGETAFVTANQARQVMEVIDAVFISSRTGQPVQLGRENFV
jgi:hypothetical protein